MKRLINKTLSLILCVSIITIGSSSVVFAGMASSVRTITENGATYKAYAQVLHRYDKIEADTELIRQSGSGGIGYLGVQAKLFNLFNPLTGNTMILIQLMNIHKPLELLLKVPTIVMVM
jgi:hypothetical protein